MKMRCKLLSIILVGVFLISSVYAVSDTAVFQGQYYDGTVFHQGTYEFKFDIYTGEIFGDLVYSDTKNLTTGTWGEWLVELDGISAACNDTTKDYFMEITIDNSIQAPRRRLTHFNYLRKNVNEITTGNLTIGNILGFLFGGHIQELTNLFVLSKDLQVQGDVTIIGEVNITGETKIQGQLVCLEDGTNCNGGEITNYWNVSGGDLFTVENYNVGLGTQNPTHELNVIGDANVTGEIYSSGQLVCLEDGTNCPVLAGGLQNILTGDVHYVRFILTVDGVLGQNDRYLPLGTDGLIATGSGESSWIIDRNLTITGILWNAVSNTRTKTSAITLFKSTSNKASFSATSLSKDIQGQASGSDNTFNVNFSQEDLAVIKYESGGSGGSINDLSVTLIGTYD